MYRYDEHDQRLVDERVGEFQAQTRRFLDGKLTEDQFRPLRLMNGLYVERYAPMLRIAIPYGELSAKQLRMLAHIARTYDRGYGHFTTRQNIQFNWPELERAPRILADLASVQMHAIQSSGNCIRNTTTDHLAGITSDEIEDPRPYCEIIRQWSTLHPEFSFLPRKFKIAVTGAARDRAASQVHDIGLHLVRNPAGEIGFEVYVGGGQGRTPVIGMPIREFLPKADLLTYFEAILRVYNLLGRRDNIYKARLKILVRSLGIERFRELVETEWLKIRETALKLHPREIERMAEHFRDPPFVRGLAASASDLGMIREPRFRDWLRQNTLAHRQPGYRAVYLSLKAPEQAPGDITAEQLDIVAGLAERYSFGEART
ncbi:MAG: nitrite/sulfite reductase, partial [Gammaproteobacteria bacterium]